VRLELGKQARCTDGAMREVVDLVVDAGNHSVTHLVVQPESDPYEARLVPVDLAAEGSNGGEISLRCAGPALDEMSRVHEVSYVGPGSRADVDSDADADGWDVGVRDMQVLPESLGSPFGGELASEAVLSYDRVPKGEIELRHASAVYSADQHHLGSVDGVIVEADGRISHLLLDRGHLWWRREISIPAAAISDFGNDMVTLGVSKGELGSFSAERRN
jgi:hypothetical protein